MNWTYDGKSFADIDPAKNIDVRGRVVAGRYRIRIEISPLMQPRPSSEGVGIHSLAGTLSAAANEIALLSLVERCALATATTAYSSATVVLGADLSYRQLAALNGLRNSDGSLRLELGTWGHAHGPNGLQGIHGTCQFVLGAEAWVRVLRESGFAELLMIEIAAPMVPEAAKLQQAVRALGIAKSKLIEQRRPSEAVATCRNALDEFRQQPPLPNDLELKRPSGQSIETLEMSERLMLLQFVLRHVTHLPIHDVASEIGMNDARLIVQLTGAFLERECRRAVALGIDG